MPLVVVTMKAPAWFEPVELSPAAPFVFGRSSDAGWPVPEDTYLSSRHFQIECRREPAAEDRETERWLLKDLGSTNGTFLNGSRITQAVLQDGDTIQAGQCSFRVILPEASFPRVLTPQERLIYLLATQPSPLYAILDASRHPDIIRLLRGTREPHRSLFEGPEGGRLAEFAPYLVRLTLQDPLLISLIYGGWGDHWGCYFTSKASFDVLYLHLRSHLLLADAEGHDGYFRFFDPRVLRKFLPRCRPDFRKAFFGPVESWLAEDEAPETALKLECRAGELSVKRIPVDVPALPGRVPR